MAGRYVPPHLRQKHAVTSTSDPSAPPPTTQTDSKAKSVTRGGGRQMALSTEQYVFAARDTGNLLTIRDITQFFWKESKEDKHRN
jgi:hypothetical protein